MNMQKSRMLVVTVVLLALAACAAGPARPDGAAAVRSKLNQLQADPQLAGRAPVAMKEAEVAVRAAETVTDDVELGRHRVTIADRKVEIARAQAQARYAEDQRRPLAEHRESARLDSRTREADNARREAVDARGDAAVARSDATLARGEAEIARMESSSARMDAAAAEQHAADLQQQLAALNAKATDRGFVVTLGDVLFASGGSTIKSGTRGDLDRLAAFLNKYPDRSVIIEGHTDSVGEASVNTALSQRRADAVRSYLVGQGVAATRIVATGLGEGSPTAGNDSATGRQQNRRVEVIISNAVASAQ